MEVGQDAVEVAPVGSSSSALSRVSPTDVGIGLARAGQPGLIGSTAPVADRRRLLRAKRPGAGDSTRKVHFRVTLAAALAHAVTPKCIEQCLHGRARWMTARGLTTLVPWIWRNCPTCTGWPRSATSRRK